LDAGSIPAASTNQFGIWDLGFGILDFGFWILDFGFWIENASAICRRFQL
jgi:hypothetical protein